MKILREINRGGYGVVYEVENDNGDIFARKVFQPQFGDTDKLKRRFIREVKVQSRIKHPNIMPISHSDLASDPPSFLMPMAGQSFKDKLESDKLAGAVDLNAWQDILAAVEELHRLGFVHRDLKPANILRVGTDWKITDFGLVLPLAAETTTLTGSTAYGTHQYCAPEQAYDFHNTPEQADIFALGCILHDNVDVNSPSRTPYSQITCAGDYAAVIAKCTERRPEDRYQSIAELRNAIFEVWQEGQPSGSAPDAAALLIAVLQEPESELQWRNLIDFLAKADHAERHAALKRVNQEILITLSQSNSVLFSKMMHIVCEWAMGTGFDWDFCDIVGDRLLAVFAVCPVRIQIQVVTSAASLAVSHNRWHVMHQVGKMLGADCSDGLVDRILIELETHDELAESLKRIEQAINFTRAKWHPKISTYLDTAV